MPPTSAPHIPVLLNEVVEALRPQAGEVMVDGTFGAGGYSRALLEAADCALIAIDRDPNTKPHADLLSTAYGDRFSYLSGCFGDMQNLLDAQVDGVTLDLGVSSMQLDEAERGFSFMRDGPLDMRMSQDGISAADLLNEAAPELLSDVIAVYGEERRARAIVKAIMARRDTQPLLRTGDLVDVICSVLGMPRFGKAHPATRTFQALRIYLNDELGELMRGLQAAEQVLKPGGRLAVVTFHSLEDRMVKQFLSPRTGRAGRPSRHLPDIDMAAPSFNDGVKRSVKADAAETEINPRARSARLRVAVRTQASAFAAETDLLPKRAPTSLSASQTGAM
ncbi:MAG: 16S rRNA (cytosine(1402)-N(4))-methyltransferase RsmH [Alphaproteobacteria bacterium]|nr:16S rRNA (cytosine(1402)-N(4))-methyltransferase RsmH [Alphaproteobacteria bacterium]